MRTLPLVTLLLCACPPSEKPDEDDTGPDTTDTRDTLPEDTGLDDCGLVVGIALGDDGDGWAPGDTLPVQVVDGGSGRAYRVSWSVSSGTIVDPAAPSTTWTVGTDIARWEGEFVDLTVQVEADGCRPETHAMSPWIDWPEAARVLVIYNPKVERSGEVAEVYADFRGVPPGNLCAIPAADATTLAAADAPAFASALQDCLATAGPQIHTLVPVWGVPYKLSGLVEDIAGTGAIATVSLDAALFLGPDFATQENAYYNPLYQDGDSMAGEYDPFVPAGPLLSAVYDDWRIPVYLVTRLDGAGADAALDLVARTAEAETLARVGELTGNVYVDARWGESPPVTDEFGSYEGGDWNMWGTKAVFEEAAAYPVVFDSNPEEFGTAPAPTACPDALYYAGWYSYYNYNDCFTWAPGAIGGHLDSCSACTLRDGGTWAAEALDRGITATFGAVNEPYVAGMPEYDQFFLYLLQGASFAEAAYEATVVGGWMMVWVGDPLYRPYREPLLAP